jgi:hypothetical protein
MRPEAGGEGEETRSGGRSCAFLTHIDQIDVDSYDHPGCDAGKKEWVVWVVSGGYLKSVG